MNYFYSRTKCAFVLGGIPNKVYLGEKMTWSKNFVSKFEANILQRPVNDFKRQWVRSVDRFSWNACIIPPTELEPARTGPVSIGVEQKGSELNSFSVYQ